MKKCGIIFIVVMIMKNKIVILFLLFTYFAFSNDIYLKINNEIISENKINENDLNDFFNSIIYFNNARALRFLKDDLKEETENSKSYYSPGFNNNVSEEIKLIDINKKNSNGDTALILAIEYHNNEILKELLNKNVDMDIKHPIFGKHPIHTAVYFENVEAVKILLEYDKSFANLANDYDGWLPLQDATLKSNVEIVKLLLNYGADPLKKDFKGNSAIDLATNFAKGEIVKLLRDRVREIRKNKI